MICLVARPHLGSRDGFQNNDVFENSPAILALVITHNFSVLELVF
jgi:hypothetical protein